MKKSTKIITSITTLALLGGILTSATTPTTTTPPPAQNQLKIGIVNFKNAVEQSKQGKQEQASFEALKKQMESTLEEKEKELDEIANKFNDPDFMDSISVEAETELKRKFRKLNEELNSQQNQFYQALNQANFKIVQKLTEEVAKASKTVAKANHFDLILNDEVAFQYNDALDLTTKVVAELDRIFDNEAKEAGQPKKEG